MQSLNEGIFGVYKNHLSTERDTSTWVEGVTGTRAGTPIFPFQNPRLYIPENYT
jgi:hypothetical protein